MKRSLRLCLFFLLAAFSSLQAQFVPSGISYQAVALDADGQPMASRKIGLRISMVSEAQNGKTIHFAEYHQVKTDDQGLFSLVIGAGKRAAGTLDAVPFGEQQIFLDVELEGKRAQSFKSMGQTRLLSVPYAFHANTASRIATGSDEPAPEEKTQSINWLTGGNSLTEPATQFLGTRDDRDFVIKTNDVTRVVYDKEGRLRYFAGVDGNSDDPNAYPLTVQGSRQGIYINVDERRTGANNFLTFGDDQQFSWGRVEGQTVPELRNTWQYRLQRDKFILAGTSLAARIAGYIIKQIAETTAACAQGAAIGTIAQIAAFATEAAALLTESINWEVEIRNEIGVTYASGAGDYAEWLPRAEGLRPLSFGEVVGVRGGVVSLNTEQGADHFFVVSRMPILLGNTPVAGQDENFEKVAFMGQVAVKVAGPVAIGDYILPSGNNDGFGIAVHPQKMKSGDYSRIVGVAWEAADGKAPSAYINTAVGINTNAMTRKVDMLNRRVDNLLAYLEGKAPLLDEEALQKMPAPAAKMAAAPKPHTKMAKLYNDEEIDALLDRYEPFLKDIYTYSEKQLRKQGYDPDANPFMRHFLDNPVPVLKEMRRNPDYMTQWAYLDQQLPKKR